MYNYVYNFALCCPMICNIYLLFALFFVSVHANHDVTNALLYLRLFQYIIYASVYVLKC